MGRRRRLLVPLLTLGLPAFLLLWFVPVPLAEGLVAAALSTRVQGATSVRIEEPIPPAILTGRASAVIVTATDASLDGGALTARDLELRLEGVGLTNGSIERVSGRFAGVVVGSEQLPVATIALDGPADAVAAELAIAMADAEALVRKVVETQVGGTAGAVSFEAPDRVRLTVDGAPITATLAVRDGALVAIADVDPSRPLVLVEAAAAQPLELRSVEVGTDGLVLRGVLAPGALGF